MGRRVGAAEAKIAEDDELAPLDFPGLHRQRGVRSSAWMPVISSIETVRTVCLAVMALR